MRYEYYTDVGRFRERNEDCIVGLTVAHPSGTHYVFSVCDGMGGGNEGQFASMTVVEELVSAFETYSLPATSTIDDVVKLAMTGVAKANSKIYNTHTRNGKLSGTTATILITDEFAENSRIIHIGDTRVYALFEGKVTQETADDTWVAAEVSAGRMSALEASVHPKRHTITKAVGIAPECFPVIFTPSIKPKGWLLSSDGFSEKLTDDDLIGLMSGQHSLAVLAEKILDRGSRDNLSAVFVRNGGA